MTPLAIAADPPGVSTLPAATSRSASAFAPTNETLLK
jgi:hypothetical protein